MLMNENNYKVSTKLIEIEHYNIFIRVIFLKTRIYTQWNITINKNKFCVFPFYWTNCGMTANKIFPPYVRTLSRCSRQTAKIWGIIILIRFEAKILKDWIIHTRMRRFYSNAIILYRTLKFKVIHDNTNCRCTRWNALIKKWKERKEWEIGTQDRRRTNAEVPSVPYFFLLGGFWILKNVSGWFQL